MKMLGSRIKERRLQLKITQAEFAEMVGTSQKQIYKYESGLNEPTAGVIVKIAHELQTTSDWLLGLTEIAERPLRGKGDLDDQELKLIELYRAKTPAERSKVLEIVKVV